MECKWHWGVAFNNWMFIRWTYFLISDPPRHVTLLNTICIWTAFSEKTIAAEVWKMYLSNVHWSFFGHMVYWGGRRTLSLCATAADDARLSCRFWDLCKINLFTSMTLICERGSASLPAPSHLSVSLFTYIHLFYDPLLFVFLLTPILFLFLPPFLQPRLQPHPGSMNHSAPVSRFSSVFPLCWYCPLRCTFIGVDKSSNISSGSHQLPVSPTDTCCWPLFFSLCRFQCLVSLLFSHKKLKTGQD